MLIRNTEQRYGAIAIFLHWLIAALIIGLLIIGLYMTRLPVGVQKLKWYGWHKELGLLVLFLAFLRILWRLINSVPRLPSTVPEWQELSAHAMHWAFYGFMFVIPMTGWLLTSAAGLPVSFFGFFVLPDLIFSSEELRLWFTKLHEWLSYGLMAAILGHSSAALWHHFINKDDVLRRML